MSLVNVCHSCILQLPQTIFKFIIFNSTNIKKNSITTNTQYYTTNILIILNYTVLTLMRINDNIGGVLPDIIGAIACSLLSIMALSDMSNRLLPLIIDIGVVCADDWSTIGTTGLGIIDNSQLLHDVPATDLVGQAWFFLYIVVFIDIVVCCTGIFFGVPFTLFGVSFTFDFPSACKISFLVFAVFAAIVFFVFFVFVCSFRVVRFVLFVYIISISTQIFIPPYNLLIL